MRNEYDYLIDKMTKRKLEIIEEEDKFSYQHPDEPTETVTVELKWLPTKDLERHAALTKSIEEENSEVSNRF